MSSARVRQKIPSGRRGRRLSGRRPRSTIVHAQDESRLAAWTGRSISPGEEERYRDGQARLPDVDDPDARQKQLTRMGNAAGGAGLALLMQGARRRGDRVVLARRPSATARASPTHRREAGDARSARSRACSWAGDWGGAEEAVRVGARGWCGRGRVADRQVRGLRWRCSCWSATARRAALADNATQHEGSPLTSRTRSRFSAQDSRGYQLGGRVGARLVRDSGTSTSRTSLSRTRSSSCRRLPVQRDMAAELESQLLP